MAKLWSPQRRAGFQPLELTIPEDGVPEDGILGAFHYARVLEGVDRFKTVFKHGLHF